MNRQGSNRTGNRGLAAILGSMVILGLGPAIQAGEEGPKAAQKGLKAMQAEGARASLTIFPVAIWATNQGEKGVGDFGKDAGRALGLLLERAGMANLETTDFVFMLPADVEFDEAAKQFGKFVQANPIKTDYALYAELVGRTGNPPQFDEIRAVIVDKAGARVWVDRQTPDDPDFKRLKPDCPMTGCYFLSERVRTKLGIPDSARDDSGEGKFARMAAEDFPGPGEEEFAAMEQRQAVMRSAGRTAKLAVFPVRLADDKVSKESAAHLANLLNEKKLSEAQVVDSPLRVEIQRSHNEQKLLWDLARAFRDHVRRNPPEADYALLADYMIGRQGGRVGAVHFVVCARTGEWVIVDFQNSHWEDFQSIDPHTWEDCGRLVAKRLEGYLR